MVVLNDRDESLIDESNILEMFAGLSGYDSPELKYKISIVFKSSKERAFFYTTRENALRDRNQLVEMVQARKLDAREL